MARTDLYFASSICQTRLSSMISCICRLHVCEAGSCMWQMLMGTNVLVCSIYTLLSRKHLIKSHESWPYGHMHVESAAHRLQYIHSICNQYLNTYASCQSTSCCHPQNAHLFNSNNKLRRNLSFQCKSETTSCKVILTYKQIEYIFTYHGHSWLHSLFIFDFLVSS